MRNQRETSSSIFGEFILVSDTILSTDCVDQRSLERKKNIELDSPHFSFRLLVKYLGRAFLVENPARTNEGSSLSQLPFEKLNFTHKYRLFSRIVDNTQSTECNVISTIHPEKYLLCKLKRLFHLLGWSMDWMLCGVACYCF
jgi:hypothetical protein